MSEKEPELHELSNTELIEEFVEYTSGSHYDGDEYYADYIEEFTRRLKLLEEFQELEKVRRTW
mgnify:CR=1 FL=1